MESSHCCNAYFRGSAPALPWKVQGFVPYAVSYENRVKRFQSF